MHGTATLPGRVRWGSEWAVEVTGMGVRVGGDMHVHLECHAQLRQWYIDLKLYMRDVECAHIARSATAACFLEAT